LESKYPARKDTREGRIKASERLHIMPQGWQGCSRVINLPLSEMAPGNWGHFYFLTSSQERNTASL